MIKQIFTKETIEHLRNNKHEITSELLKELRSHGNTGKQIALDILDLPKDNEQYYLDAFGSRMSFNGNRRLKKAFTKVSLSPIHFKELEKCANDIHYFKENYVKITTPKGLNFPDLRIYQDDFINTIIPDDNEAIVGLCPRQSGKTLTVGIYLAHKYIFCIDMNIGIAANKTKQSIEFLDKTKKIIVELPLWMQTGMTVWNKTFIENENNMRIITDSTSSDSFRGFTCAIIIVDECGFVKTKLWEAFSDSIFPSQSGLAWKKNILISTANGINFFYNIVKGAREKANGYINFEVNWRDVPRYRPDGSLMPPEEFQKKIIDKHGLVYFNQNYGNEFGSSSYTLLSADKLQSLASKNAKQKLDNKLNIYVEPKKDHKYIMTVDAAKDGKDAFAVQVADITDFTFVQVASANLQIDYLLMPEFIYSWCQYYNNPYLIIENNEGAGQSIADQMYQTYEYENLHFDSKVDSNTNNIAKSFKGYPGFRTTSKTRKQIIQTMKLFIENDRLIINDKDTIEQLYHFILTKNKYQADDGAQDDMIISLALVFAPFVNIKNFEDMRKLVQSLYRTRSEDTEHDVQFSDLLTAAEFHSGTDTDIEEFNPKKEYLTLDEAIEDMDGFY